MAIIKNFLLPQDNKRGPNCGVTAIAASAGISFARAWSLCATAPSRATKRFKGGTVHRQRIEVLDHIGMPYQVMQLPKMTLQKFCDIAQEDTTYMVTTTRHVQLVRVIDGQPYILDQTGCKPIEEYWGRRKYITKDVLKMGEALQATKPQPKPQQPVAKHPQANSTLFPSLFPNQHNGQAPQQLSLF